MIQDVSLSKAKHETLQEDRLIICLLTSALKPSWLDIFVDFKVRLSLLTYFIDKD